MTYGQKKVTMTYYIDGILHSRVIDAVNAKETVKLYRALGAHGIKIHKGKINKKETK